MPGAGKNGKQDGKRRKRKRANNSKNASAQSGDGNEEKPVVDTRHLLSKAEFEQWQKKRFDPVEAFVKKHSILIQNFPHFGVGGSKLIDVIKGFLFERCGMPREEVACVTEARRLSSKTVRVEFCRSDIPEKCVKFYRLELRKHNLKFSGANGQLLDFVSIMADRTEQQVKVNVELQKVLVRLRSADGFRKVWQHDMNQIGVTFAGKPEGAEPLIRSWRKIKDELEELRVKNPEFFVSGALAGAPPSASPVQGSAIGGDNVNVTAMDETMVAGCSSSGAVMGAGRDATMPFGGVGRQTGPLATSSPDGGASVHKVLATQKNGVIRLPTVYVAKTQP